MTRSLYGRSLFLFRRDLRIEDNTALRFALESSQWVIPAFLFTPEQIEENRYRGDPCLQFMIESLEELSEQLREKKGKLYLFFGKPEEVVAQCIRRCHIEAIVVNRDYTPYSVSRDRAIEAVCKEMGIAFHSFDDALLHPPETTVKENGKPYTVFSPFFRKASSIGVESPSVFRRENFFSEPIPFSYGHSLFAQILPNRREQVKGGRSRAIILLDKLDQLDNYRVKRDFPALEATSNLSPHLKFTTCSPREIYERVVDLFGVNSDLIRSLYWRDFFTSIGYFFPSIFGSSFQTKGDEIPWSDDEAAFGRWCEGTTGFPIVDAGMRQLQETGELPNRVRMIVASFLVKDLHVDWRWGERFFARSLIDYDPAVNNGNWQWVAGTGCDAQPYFRIFNPWVQQKKFDPKALYIKKWVPELRNIPSKQIHLWKNAEYRPSTCEYPVPIVEHAIEAEHAVRLHRKRNT